VPGVPTAVFWGNEMTFDAIVSAPNVDVPAACSHGVATPRPAPYTGPSFEPQSLSKVA
jgi:hypothetical protein